MGEGTWSLGEEAELGRVPVFGETMKAPEPGNGSLVYVVLPILVVPTMFLHHWVLSSLMPRDDVSWGHS